MKSSPLPQTPPASLIMLYDQLFVGRRSDFALQRENGRYRRVGRPLTTLEVFLHLRGTQTVGTYVTDEHGYCRTPTYDDDTEHGLERLYQVQMQLAHDGIVSYLEQSRRGGHLRVFLAQPILASQVRDWLLPYALTDMEFYPKQAEGQGYGSLVRLPFGVHRLTGRRYPFLCWSEQGARPVATSLYDQLSWLETIQRVPIPSERLSPLASDEQQRNTHKSLTAPYVVRVPYSTTTIHAWCAIQDPFSVIGRYVTFDHRGMAHCPFHEHHIHSKDRHPSFKVYEPTHLGGSCWYCYTWNKGGTVFNFLCYWYDVDARTMWQRIQKGELL